MKRRLALAIVGVFIAVAVLADFIAADRPIAASRGGELSLLDNITDTGPRGDRLSSTLGEGDWALWPPIRRGPISVRSAGEIRPTQPPSKDAWLGTDDRGRDVLARLIHGTRSTLVLAFSVSLGALVFGIGLALAATAGSRRVNALIVAITDVGSGLPLLILVVAAAGLWGGEGLALAAGVLIVPRAADAARIAIGEIERALAKPFSDAAVAAGVSRFRLLWRHALPNALPQLRVATALTASLSVLAEAALSFLGFGAKPPQPSWGELLAQAHQNDLAWWLLWPAGLCAFALAAAFAQLASSEH